MTTRHLWEIPWVKINHIYQHTYPLILTGCFIAEKNNISDLVIELCSL